VFIFDNLLVYALKYVNLKEGGTLDKRIYDGYAYGDLGYPEMHTHLLPLISSGQTALDIGFGTGHTCSPVAFSGLKIDGVDRNGYWLDCAKDAFAEAGLGDLLNTIDSEALEFLKANTKKYDLVIMSDLLMFQTKTAGKMMIELAYGALQPNGLIWITTMSTRDHYYSRMVQSQNPIDDETFMAYSPCGGSGPMCFYFPTEIGSLLESYGAKMIFSTETESSAGGMVNIILAQKPA